MYYNNTVFSFICLNSEKLQGGSGFFLILSLFNIIAAGGDTSIALMLLKHKNAMIIDHPTECGFWAFRKNKKCSMRFLEI